MCVTAKQLACQHANGGACFLNAILVDNLKKDAIHQLLDVDQQKEGRRRVSKKERGT